MRKINFLSKRIIYQCTLHTTLKNFLTANKFELDSINSKGFYIYKVISSEQIYLRKKHRKDYDSAIIIITSDKNLLLIDTKVDYRAYSFYLLMISWILMYWFITEIRTPVFYPLILILSLLYTLLLIHTVQKDFNSIQTTIEKVLTKENINFEK